jgi:hypothetical protein
MKEYYEKEIASSSLAWTGFFFGSFDIMDVMEIDA